jgi:hypothetical protein
MTDRRAFSDRRSMPDLEPPLRAWLSQPVELPESDLARIAWLVHNTPQQRRWSLPYLRSASPMFTAFKLTAASAILASVGLFLFNAAPTRRVDLPAASPSPTAAAILAPSASPADSPGPDASAAPLDLGPVVLQLAPGDGTRVGDWVKLGSRSTSNGDGTGWSGLSDLQAIGPVMVARAVLNLADETEEHHLLASVDGLAWSSIDLPARDVAFTHLFAGPDGLVLAGQDTDDGTTWTARLWTSPDGLTWSETPAPGRKTIDQIVSFGEPRIVRIGDRLWASRDGGDWEQTSRATGFRILAGPGGFQLWGDGGSGSSFFMQHADEAFSELVEVGVPRQIDPSDANLGVVGDQWVLVPSLKRYPDTILVSPDGVTWREVPRPVALTGQEMRWITEVDGQAMAYGPSLDDEGVGAVWTWTLGEAAPEHALFPRSDEYLLEPAELDGTVYAPGAWSSEASEASMWVYQPEG